MTKDKLKIVVPNEDDFDPAPIPFGVVTGVGVPDYDNVKSKGKRGGVQYSISIILNKEQRAAVLEQVLKFWEDHKPKRAGSKPVNFKNIVREGEGDYAGSFIMYAKTQTEFNGTPNIIPIRNQDCNKLDPEQFGYIGKGSEGRIAVTLLVYGDDDEAGVSVFLSEVKLTKFVKLEASGGVSAFGTKDKGDVEAGSVFKSEKKPVDDDDDDEIKSNKKPVDDDDDDDDDEEEEVKPKKVKKDKKDKNKNKF